jgi:hypothetical protein
MGRRLLGILADGTCEDCRSSYVVRWVRPVSGWGTDFARYLSTRRWCFWCCRRNNGHFRLAYENEVAAQICAATEAEVLEAVPVCPVLGRSTPRSMEREAEVLEARESRIGDRLPGADLMPGPASDRDPCSFDQSQSCGVSRFG